MNVSGATYHALTAGSIPPERSVSGVHRIGQPTINPASEKHHLSEASNQINQTNASPDTKAENTEQQASQKNGDHLRQTDAAQTNGQGLTPEEMRIVEELKKIDSEVRRHEMAHIAVGGRYITSGANFKYQRGPDGKNYAVAGEVTIDTSAVPGDPQATLQKMRQVKNAALAPANPSPQDLKVAAKASAAASKALSDLMALQAKEQADSNENQAFGSLRKAADEYERVNNLPEQRVPSFQIAV